MKTEGHGLRGPQGFFVLNVICSVSQYAQGPLVRG